MRETGINFGEILRKMMERECVTIQDLEAGSDIGNSHIYSLLNNKHNPNIKTINKILNYLGYDIAFVKRKEK